MIENIRISKTIQNIPELEKHCKILKMAFSVRKKVGSRLCVREYTKEKRGFFYIGKTREIYYCPYSRPNTSEVLLTKEAVKIVMSMWKNLSEEEKLKYEKKAKRNNRTWKGHNLFFREKYRAIYNELKKLTQILNTYAEIKAYIEKQEILNSLLALKIYIEKQEVLNTYAEIKAYIEKQEILNTSIEVV